MHVPSLGVLFVVAAAQFFLGLGLGTIGLARLIWLVDENDALARIALVWAMALTFEGVFQFSIWAIASDPDAFEVGLNWPAISVLSVFTVVVIPAVLVWRTRYWWQRRDEASTSRPAV